MTLTHRLATPDDMPALTGLMDAAIGDLQAPFLTPGQIAASRLIMGLDSQLIADGTYFVVEADSGGGPEEGDALLALREHLPAQGEGQRLAHLSREAQAREEEAPLGAGRRLLRGQPSLQDLAHLGLILRSRRR